MQKIQFCNIADSLVVYNFIPFKHLISVCRSGRIAFKRISDWEDVYENYAFKEKYQLKGGITVTTAEAMQNRLYGQCWTDANETDAMWRIYSHIDGSLEDSAVRTKTTIGKIRSVLSRHNYDIRHVEYLPQTQIETFPTLHVCDLEQFFRDSSFKKRIEFSHEQEVRVVIEDESINENLLKVLIPSNFFDEYVLDPRLSNKQEELIRKQLLSVGISNRSVRKSDLYKFNVQTIQIQD